MNRRMFGPILGTALLLGLAGCGSSEVKVGDDAIAGLTPDATVSMEQVQVAYLASGGGGTGKLHYKGRTHEFTIGGVGVGGIGASSLEAEGEVYRLPNLEAFGGTYAQSRYGYALGTASGGVLWMQNDAGVIMKLRAKRTGLMLSLGADAVVISLKR